MLDVSQNKSEKTIESNQIETTIESNKTEKQVSQIQSELAARMELWMTMMAIESYT